MMKKYTKSQEKKMIHSILDPFLKSEKLKKYNSWENGYDFRTFTSSGVLMSYMSFNTFDPPGYGIGFSINSVEDIILEIGLPNFELTSYREKKDFFITIPLYYFDKNSINANEFSTESDYFKFAQDIIDHYHNVVPKLIDYISYLPNILKEMDKLEAEGINWIDRDKGIIHGALDGYFRGLIIAKLCNDPNLDKKIELMNIKFATKGYESWLPYYMALKDRLNTLDPIYNI